ncbi:MAG: toll/interleukin-1 receptor domain-containing protein [Desulfobacterales bacterium]
MSSLTGKAFEYYSCFISYSSRNQDFAERLYSDLQNKGVRCWFAPEDMKIGDKIRDRIDQSIRIHDKLLLVLSENSIPSEWVEDEVEAAYEQERQRGKTVLFPIRLDSAVMDTDKAWATKLRRTRHIGDFTQWKAHGAYKKAFDRLMRDLKADKPAGND